jgi:hypothetical protein
VVNDQPHHTRGTSGVGRTALQSQKPLWDRDQKLTRNLTRAATAFATRFATIVWPPQGCSLLAAQTGVLGACLTFPVAPLTTSSVHVVDASVGTDDREDPCFVPSPVGSHRSRRDGARTMLAPCASRGGGRGLRMVSARGRIADFWDELTAAWLAGEDPLPDPLPDWYASYGGRGDGRVTRDAFAEPY